VTDRKRNVRLQTLRGIYGLSEISNQDVLFRLQVGSVFAEVVLIMAPPLTDFTMRLKKLSCLIKITSSLMPDVNGGG